MHPSFPGSELTKDPFRWDQRIFSIVLRFKGNSDNDFVDSVPFDTQINAMCEVTGGKPDNDITAEIRVNGCQDELKFLGWIMAWSFPSLNKIAANTFT